MILAVAGSGKTTHLVDSLDVNKRTLILTYTIANYENLRKKVAARFRVIPNNIVITTYFSLLYSFAIRPFKYRSQLSLKVSGLRFDMPPERSRYLKSPLRFIGGGFIYHSRAINFVNECVGFDKFIARFEMFFDEIFIDEVQDFAGYDFDLIEEILPKVNVRVLCCGDFYQHTFDTSRDGNKNKSLYTNCEKYKRRLRKVGYEIDEKLLSVCHRCQPAVCDLIARRFGMQIVSGSKDGQSNVRFVDELSMIKRVVADNKIEKLFYDDSAKYLFPARNWGASKGLEFNDVCVFVNNDHWRYLQGEPKKELNPKTRNKLYVACSRTRGNLYIVDRKYVVKQVR